MYKYKVNYIHKILYTILYYVIMLIFYQNIIFIYIKSRIKIKLQYLSEITLIRVQYSKLQFKKIYSHITSCRSER